MGSQGRLMASHICDGSKSARRIDGRIGVTNRERETRGPKRPVGSPAERLSLAILLVCFVASSLVCRCFVGVGRGWHGGGRPPPEATATCVSVNHIRRREVVPIRDSGRLEHADGEDAATHGLSASLTEIAARNSVKGAGRVVGATAMWRQSHCMLKLVLTLRTTGFVGAASRCLGAWHVSARRRGTQPLRCSGGNARRRRHHRRAVSGWRGGPLELCRRCGRHARARDARRRRRGRRRGARRGAAAGRVLSEPRRRRCRRRRRERGQQAERLWR